MYAVNRLQKRRLIKRVISERDLRSFGLTLTEEGKAALKEHYEKEEAVISSMLQVFDNPEEREMFVKLFTKLVDNFT